MNFVKHLHDLWFLPSLYKIQIHQEQRHPIIWQCKRFISKVSCCSFFFLLLVLQLPMTCLINHLKEDFGQLKLRFMTILFDINWFHLFEFESFVSIGFVFIQLLELKSIHGYWILIGSCVIIPPVFNIEFCLFFSFLLSSFFVVFWFFKFIFRIIYIITTHACVCVYAYVFCLW